ncbi:MAG: tRNA preQ1(34) S-adenosylmethionine ribosyltransferase-isomerase QueA [Fibrobacteria bacterium]|nr:tRNA preQ1(34) S-adenosylmethionine ribosyltransferase-isomerase QueA [Fibrobacteria bacterium]
MKLSDFDFDFPKELIAEHPVERGMSKMMVVSPNDNNEPIHDKSRNLINYLSPGDGLFVNETKVIPARLFGKSPSGGKIEILLLKKVEGREGLCWEVMTKPAKRCKIGLEIIFGSDFSGHIAEQLESSHRLVCFSGTEDSFPFLLEKYGEMPIPPYIKRSSDAIDKERYQSVFAKYPGSVAAPTASFHFSEQHLNEIEKKGIALIKGTLHVGAGTFKPVECENILEHDMHGEYYELSAQAAEMVNSVKQNKGKIWAVGTTSARILETLGTSDGRIVSGSGITHKFIYPGYQWKVVDGLLTNFHWPKSTLFMLVSSILGVNKAKKSYQNAIKNNYRLFSYGDSMLIC